jgi:hypothetical protein
LCPACCKPAQHHDLHQAADMQRRRGGIEADIAGHDLLGRERIEPCGIGQLVDIAALVEQAEQGSDLYWVMTRARLSMEWHGRMWSNPRSPATRLVHPDTLLARR